MEKQPLDFPSLHLTGAAPRGRGVFLFALIRPHRRRLGLALAATAVAAGALLALGVELKHLVNSGFSDVSGHALHRALLALATAALVLAAAGYARIALSHAVAERAVAELRRQIHRHLLSLDAAYFDTHAAAGEVARLTADTAVLQLALTGSLPFAFRHALTLLGSLAMLAVMSPSLTLATLLALPTAVAPVLWLARRVRKKSRAVQEHLGTMSALAQETVEGVQTVQSFGAEETLSQLFAARVRTARVAALQHVRARAATAACIIAVGFLAVGFLFWAGGHQVLDGRLTAGDFSAFVFYAVLAAGAAGSLGESLGAFQQASGALDRILSLLATQPPSAAGRPPGKIRGGIVFDRVTFAYPSRAGSKALTDVSFTLTPGQHAALVGPSGAGKTTVFQLLQLFYRPQSGDIRIDGENLAAFAPAAWRRQVGVVAQEPTLFSFSVAENIRLGRPEASDDDVRRAAERAGADAFVRALPQGYDTPLGERGRRLSGGERQRIALARVFLKDPALLLLDEATSALDRVHEDDITAALAALMEGRTSIAIAHRLSTVESADPILLIDQGRIVAVGTHAALRQSNPLYQSLVSDLSLSRSGLKAG